MALVKLEVDSQTVCRVCLQESEDEMISIYDHDGDATALCIFEKIEKCGGIKILKDSQLPNRICIKCKAFLTIAHKFRIICRNSDNYLREFVCKAKYTNPKEDDDDNAEYLYEYQTDTHSEHSANDEFIISTDNSNLNEHIEELNQSNLEFEEVDEYTELWLNDNEHVNDAGNEHEIENDLIEEDHSEFTAYNNNTEYATEQHETEQVNTSKPTAPVKKTTTSKKTLDISSDGTAVIRVKKAEKQLHICDICGNTYPRKYALEAHMRRHRDERPFECEICHQAFHLNFQLTRHIRKHTGIRPYSCSYCKRSFADRSTMVKHERIHRNERPYTCDTCGKSFTYSSVLKVHKLTHTGEKPFTCGICGKRFARGHHLRAHLETLLHQHDPRVKSLLKQIKREEDIAEENIDA